MKGDGYRIVSIDGTPYLAHRLIFAIQHDARPKPKLQIDHIKRIGDGNRPENLRLVTPAENCRNARLSKNNTSGVTGVSWHAKAVRWQVQMMVEDRYRYLGTFATKEAAIEARRAAEVEYGYHPNFGREKNHQRLG